MFATSVLNLRTFKPEVSLAFLFAAVLFCVMFVMLQVYSVCARVSMAIKNVGELSIRLVISLRKPSLLAAARSGKYFP